jgi:hypothetical protein
MSRRAWKAPVPNPTPMARQVWAQLWPDEPWPKGWRVEWVGFMRGVLGMCKPRSQRIILSYGDAKKANGVVVRTLVHEMLHMRCGKTFGPKRNRWHSKDFYEIERRLYLRLGIPPPVRVHVRIAA